MEKNKLSKGISPTSATSFEDIPAAKRDVPKSSSSRNPKSSTQPILIAGIVGFATTIAIAIALWLPNQTRSASNLDPASQTRSSGSTSNLSNASNQAEAGASQGNTTGTTTAASEQDALLGHLVYPEAPQSTLKAITADGRIKLRQAAAEKFQAMTAAA